MQPAQIERLLPLVIRRTGGHGSVLTTLIELMSELVDPSEQVIERIDEHLDPRRAPESMLLLLAAWLDLDRLVQPYGNSTGTPPFAPGAGRLRELLASATDLSHSRGTAAGIESMLTIATGSSGYVVDERSGGPFHLRVVCPGGAQPHAGLIEHIVDSERPAYMTYGIEFATNGPPTDEDTA